MTRPRVFTQVSFSTGPLDTPVYEDISGDCRRITIRRGRQHELDQDEAGQASVLIRNSARKYDPTHTGSIYYPDVKPMRRLRVGASTDAYLDIPTNSGDYASCLDSVALSIAGDLDLRALIDPDDWTPTDNSYAVSKSSTPDYGFGVSGGANTGKLFLAWNRLGVDSETQHSTVTTGFSTGTPRWIRATLDVDDGAGNHVVRFYTSTDGVDWTQLGDDVSAAGAVTVRDSSARLYLGGGPFPLDGLAGKIYEAQVYSGIDGTLVADFAAGMFFQDEDGTLDASVRDSLRNTWTIGGDATIEDASQYLFSGYTLRWPQKWPRKRNAVVELTATDAFHPLNLLKLTASYSAEASDDRVDTVLDAVGFPASDRNIGTGKSTIVASELAKTPALEHLQHVVLSENGRLFVSAAGKLTFVGRWELYSSPYTTSQGTFGDASGEMPYLDLTVSYDESQIYNYVYTSIAGSDTYQLAVDTTSRDNYFPRSLTRPNLLLSSTTETQAAADFLLRRYKDPKLRFEQMVLDGERSPSALWPQIVGRELGDRITVKRRPPGGGSVLTQESYIEGIEHKIGPKTWRTTWDLSPASADTFGLLDDPVLGLPDSTLIPLY